MPHVPGLRSPYAKVGRLVYFGRMLDKIRLHARGALPADYQANLGAAQPNVFDARCCRFLGVSYEELRDRTLAGASDDVVLAWAESQGGLRSDDECNVWNRFMMKIGWRDDRSALLQQRIASFGLEGRPIETFFDLIDFDEGRDPLRRRAWELRPARVLVLMGVAGSGKTTIGQELASQLGWPFADADGFHPAENIAKMAAGQPLDDKDRAPWLRAIRDHILECLRTDESAVVTCSALKDQYRQMILCEPTRTRLIYLKGDRDLLLRRLQNRQSHFMKPTMLDSQLAALEEPRDALTIGIDQDPASIIAEIRRAEGL